MSMKKISLLLLLMLCMDSFAETAVLSVDSVRQETASKRGFWQHGIGKLLVKADNMLKSWESSDIDTNYIRVPERDRQVYIGGYGYYQHHNMEFPILVTEVDIPTKLQNYIPSNYNDKRYLKTSMHTTQTEMELGVDWRGLTLELPITLMNKYSHSIGLAKNGSVWGFRLRFKHLKEMNGYVENAFDDVINRMGERYYAGVADSTLSVNHDPVETEKRDLESGDMELQTFYMEGYYVFNHRKFSLGAGMYADMVQRRPAGSFFVMANYYQSELTCNYLLDYSRDRFRTAKLSVGAGYGYNLPFYDGRLCLHFSAIPMISLLNTVSHAGWDDELTDPETIQYNEHIAEVFRAYDEHFYDACDYGRDSKFTVNGFARMAANYSFDRYIITFLANYRQYLFSSSSGLKIGNHELDVQLNLCYRF